MSETVELCDPWLLAAWPGMGNVALGAGTYLVEQLGAEMIAEITDQELFDIERVEVKDGITTVGRLPRNMFFAWKDPRGQRDLLIFIGEAQPSKGGYGFCQRLLDFAVKRGVRRFFTFAAMATQLHPSKKPRVFGVATKKKLLRHLRALDTLTIQDGEISGLNGVLLAAGAERNLEGICLLGELPFFAIHVPNPRTSQVVLDVFGQLAKIDLDLSPMEQQAETVERQLLELMDKLGQETHGVDSDEDFMIPEFANQDENETPIQDQKKNELDSKSRRRIEGLFAKASQDRAKALELKQELDRLGVFSRYEDRFLDLFKRAD